MDSDDEVVSLKDAMTGAMAAIRAHQGTPDGQAQALRFQELATQRRRRELFDLAADRGVPLHPEMLGIVVSETPGNTPAMLAVEEVLEWRRKATVPGFPPPPVTAVLSGSTGTGKSTALARAVVRWPRGAHMVSARDIAVLGDSGWSESAALRRKLATISLLAVDEAGLEEHVRAGERIGGILCERHDRALVSLIATNLEAKEWVARYADARLRSRLSLEQTGRGCPWWRELPAGDMRDKNGTEKREP